MNEKFPGGDPNPSEEKPTEEIDASLDSTQKMPTNPDEVSDDLFPTLPFTIHESVNVQRSSGETEEDWQVAGYEQDSEHGLIVRVTKPASSKGKKGTEKWVRADDLIAWQPAPEESEVPANEEDEKSESSKEQIESPGEGHLSEDKEVSIHSDKPQSDVEASGAGGGDDIPPEAPTTPEDNGEDDEPRPILSRFPGEDRDAYEQEYLREHDRPYKPPKSKLVHYETDSDRTVQFADRLRRDTYVDWQELLAEKGIAKEELTAIIKGSLQKEEVKVSPVTRQPVKEVSKDPDFKYLAFIKEGKIYEVQWQKGQAPKVSTSELPEDGLLPNLVVGHKITGSKPPLVIDRVEIAGSKGYYNPQHVESTRFKSELRQGVVKTAEHKREEETIKRFKNKGKNNPFAYIDEAITRIESGDSPVDHLGRVAGSKGWEKSQARLNPEIPPWKKDRLSSSEIMDARLRVEELAQRLSDELYVPSPKEFKEIRGLAKLIKVTGLDTETPTYRFADGTALDSAQAETFIKNAQNGRWVMTAGEETSIKKASAQTTYETIHSRKLFTNIDPALKRESSHMLIQDFKKILESRGEVMRPIPKDSERYKTADKEMQKRYDEHNRVAAMQVGKRYKEYLLKRVKLSHSIREKAGKREYMLKDENTGSQAVDAYADMVRRKAEEEADKRKKQRHQRERTIYHSRKFTVRRRKNDLIDRFHLKRWEISDRLSDRFKEATKRLPEEERALRQVARSRRRNQKIDRALSRINQGNARIDAAVQRKMDKIADKAAQIPEKIDRGLDKIHQGNMRIDAAVRKKMDATAIAADKGMDAVHRGNMKIDAAIQNKAMDPAAAKAAQAKAAAEEFKQNWDGNLEELLAKPPADLTGEALRDYIDWQKEQAEQFTAKDEAKKAARKTAIAAAKLRRRGGA